nr:pentatricopeptide repeat containing protein [Sorghum bicolor]
MPGPPRAAARPVIMSRRVGAGPARCLELERIIAERDRSRSLGPKP